VILDPDSVTKTEYLYGISPSILMDMNYKQAIEIKLKLAKVLIADLYEIHRDNRDEDRITEIYKSIKYNNKLLAELK
jgi:hypothetical protein